MTAIENSLENPELIPFCNGAFNSRVLISWGPNRIGHIKLAVPLRFALHRILTGELVDEEILILSKVGPVLILF